MSGPTFKTYTIRTLADFAQIPADRLGDALRQLHYSLALTAVVSAEDRESRELSEWHWHDDGEMNVELHDDDGENVTLRASIKCP